jgi:hypothetical protein
MTTTLNGFPSSWYQFVQGICTKSKLPKFNKLWADFTQADSMMQEHRSLIKRASTSSTFRGQLDSASMNFEIL